jgi:hypothetical protein
MGSYVQWETAPDHIKLLYHHYRSKDDGIMFHQKFILAYHHDQPSAVPFFIYVGSHNLSASAWGNIKLDLSSKKAKESGALRLEGVNNMECGVVIRGADIQGMMESGEWEEVVSYVRPVGENVTALKYNIEDRRDRPWNSPE